VTGGSSTRPTRKVAGRWTYLYRAVDQHGQVIDVLASERRDAYAARAFFVRVLQAGPAPLEVTTDRAPVYPRVIEVAVPAARHELDQYANNRVEADHGRLKARLRPMRGLKTTASLRTIAAGHAFVQNLRRGHYEITADVHLVIESESRSPNWPNPCNGKGLTPRRHLMPCPPPTQQSPATPSTAEESAFPYARAPCKIAARGRVLAVAEP
jgi:hypothetical protein